MFAGQFQIRLPSVGLDSHVGGGIKKLTLHALFSQGKESLGFSTAVQRKESTRVSPLIRKELFFTFLLIHVCINGHRTAKLKLRDPEMF